MKTNVLQLKNLPPTRSRTTFFKYLNLLAMVLIFSVNGVMGQVSITSLPQTYTQNFDGLGSSSANWTDNSTLSGWYISTSTLPISTGTTSSGTCVNVGIAGTNALTDRAIGCLQSNSTNQRFGLRVKNNSSSSITSFSISFTGEQWRSFNAGTLVFEYQISSSAITSLTAGSWTAATAFNFASLQTSSGAALDGNAIANRTAISGTLTVTVAAASEIFFRFTRNTNSSPILAIDDLSITANGTSSLTPPTLTAAGTATVDNAFNVTFPDDATWRAAITSITVGGTTLTAGSAVSSGQIAFTPSASSPTSLLQSSGSKSIVVIATGYNNATVLKPLVLELQLI